MRDDLHGKVTIPSGETYVLDEDTVVLERLTIKGKLLVLDKFNVVLKTKQLWIKGGIFEAGTAETPLLNDFSIEMYGTENDDGLNILPDLYELRNSIIINGDLSIVGKSGNHTTHYSDSDFAVCKLTSTVKAGDKSLKVSSVDQHWEVG